MHACCQRSNRVEESSTTRGNNIISFFRFVKTFLKIIFSEFAGPVLRQFRDTRLPMTFHETLGTAARFPKCRTVYQHTGFDGFGVSDFFCLTMCQRGVRLCHLKGCAFATGIQEQRVSRLALYGMLWG